MPLPRVTADIPYRIDEVDMQPGGSTITVTVPSDNPFEIGADPVVVTQASGGITGADPRQRSKKLIHKKGVRYVTRGFMPGMGDGEEFEMGLYGPVARPSPTKAKKRLAKKKEFTITARGFLPGMGNEDDSELDGFADFLRLTHPSLTPEQIASRDALRAARQGVKSANVAARWTRRVAAHDAAEAARDARWAARVARHSGSVAGFGDEPPPMIAAPTAPAAPEGPGFLEKLGTGTVGLIREVSPTYLAARDQQLKAQQTQVEQTKARAALEDANARRIAAGMPPLQALPTGLSTTAKVGIGVGAVAVLGLLAFLMLRK